MRYFIPLLLLSGCNGENLVEVVTDPNTIQTTGEVVKAVGITIGRPEVIAAGVIFVAIAVFIKTIRRN